MTDSTTTTLDDLFRPDDLRAALAEGWVGRKAHPELPLSLYSYTRRCVFDNAWTPVTTRCRGLVVEDATGRIVAHCLPKFFNHGEHGRGNAYAPPLPDGAFEILDKEDGSLGLVFHYADHWRVASKGAFESQQAVWAQEWLDERDTRALDPALTYVTEIIHPDNRIVVDNGGERTLVLLAVFGPGGTERPLAAHADAWAAVGGRVVGSWPAVPIADVLRAAANDRALDGTATTGSAGEGWVLRYASGLRVKVKLTDYVRLHRIMTGVTERDIWRYLGMQRFAGRDPRLVAYALTCSEREVAEQTAPFDALLDLVPDEFDTWVRAVAAGLTERARELDDATRAAFTRVAHLGEDGAAFAKAAQSVGDRQITAGLFLLRDGRPIDLPIWRAVKPETAARFAEDDHG
ncbi:RNA ligase [Streptomyces sp. SID3343]|uniref:RNA ligase n=1 Tax=Streptomyces sp. SID3343 TaxID=2690260 RepID=UPI00137039C4|nr:RNA ligase [Streptomyces sp. SID3343]MYV99871.1 polynucleotide kinase [Streptomyces sp. SID3343]